MRVIAGKYRSRKLNAPEGQSTRPTSDRLRETLFNVLASRTGFEGVGFVDLYAGSGAVGIEARSRGVANVWMVERSESAIRVLRANLSALGISEGVHVEPGSVAAFLRRKQRAMGEFGIVFLDPPYDAAEEYEATLQMLGGESLKLLAPEALVVAEHRRKGNKLTDQYGGLRRTRLLEQGDAALSFYAAADQGILLRE
jgi:16S rRNA (guanine(966)-N(2))-methyltransferase RsmD